MKIYISNKKILAREFFFFILCLTIFALTFLFIFLYNHTTQNQSANFAKQVLEKNILIDSIQDVNNKKTEAQTHFSYNYRKEFDIDFYYGLNSELWNVLYRIAKADSIKHRWENKWERSLINFNEKMGYKNPEEFTNFIKSNIIYSSDISLIEKIEKETMFLKSQQIEKYNDFIELREQFRISFLVFLISFFILFVLRYLIYGTKWSLKVLKES